MATTRAMIRRWVEEGKEQGATHTIIVCDSFDYEDYPVHVMPGEDVHKKLSGFNFENMQRVMEVYNHSMDLEEQLAEHRAMHC